MGQTAAAVPIPSGCPSAGLPPRPRILSSSMLDLSSCWSGGSVAGNPARAADGPMVSPSRPGCHSDVGGAAEVRCWTRRRRAARRSAAAGAAAARSASPPGCGPSSRASRRRSALGRGGRRGPVGSGSNLGSLLPLLPSLRTSNAPPPITCSLVRLPRARTDRSAARGRSGGASGQRRA